MEQSEVDELMARVRKLEVKTKRLVRETFAGEYHSSFKGQGLDFDDYREYQPGDEIRFIDWNVSARTGEPYVRTFREERELTVILMIDVSASTLYGSVEKSKRELAAELAAVLAFSARANNDKVGALLFADEPLLYLPPAKTNQQVLRIVRETFVARPEKGGANLKKACEYLNRVHRKKALAFVISDFIDLQLDRSLLSTARNHDLVALRVEDPAEETLPKVGRVAMHDPETGYETIVNTSHSNVRMAYRKLRTRQIEGLEKYFKKGGIDYAKFRTDEDYFPKLLKLLKRRNS